MYNEIISKPVSVVNSTTGEIQNYSSVLIEDRTISKAKRGWTKMYRIGYDEVARQMTSSLEYDIFTAIRDSYEPKTFILKFTQEGIAKQLDTTRSTVARVVKKLKQLDFIRKDKSIIKMNPYIYVPPNMKDIDIADAQEQWKGEASEKDKTTC